MVEKKLKFKDFFLIAEAGINHNGNLKKAFRLVDEAKKSGASAIKFQTYTTEKRVKKDSPIFKILKKCELNYDNFLELKNYCDKKKIVFFSTPFDKEAVNFLADIKVKLFKISSFDISNYELIKSISSKKIPTIISTGMASLKEIDKINSHFNLRGIDHHILHCISKYPNIDEDSLLSNITFLKKRYNCQIGLSDHTNDIKTSIYSYFLGARIFENHFKLSKYDSCVDSPVSITPQQMRGLYVELKKIPKILGKSKFGIRDIERNAKIFKRSRIL
jgi:N,N'-diacetyllegionaminate synthase